ncbi:hypothetical protein [Maridesulfovibrio salexigens]|uniref:Uncharacterized protein n=1 Tax=Maridesulfovibrio salexigens (strain ATCC 14822 / DSM 2638 / NCIMB 8403 / VKM B-1763) TaxID=526222 RepID=C6BRQ0_MARSD|nr:hypothetical protein [Maridesulfovibrio salexigens]ACS79490.1 hypothetical protein Desal_1428 [Maridesulfovibrio salexigens DSM 2638]
MATPKTKLSEPQKVQNIIQNLIVHTDGKNSYVEIPSENHRKQLAIVSCPDFKDWFEVEYSMRYNKYAPNSSLNGAISSLRKRAKNSAKVVEIHRRFAQDGKNQIIDLCDPANNNVIEINSSGWKITQNSSVIFSLEDNFKSIDSNITRSGNLWKLFKYINVKGKVDRIKLLAWICSLPMAVENPILLLKGVHASGKTTAAERIREIFDPASPMKMSISSNESDLALAFYSNPVCFFDNVGGITKRVADMFCKAVTGDGYSKRELYSDSNMVHYEYKRPVIMTSIHNPTTRKDFLSRCLPISMNSIGSGSRICESEIDAEFQKDLPDIRGGILDLIVLALNIKDKIKLHHQTRLGDFDKFGAAIAYELGLDPNTFIHERLESEKKASLAGTSDLFFESLVEVITDSGGALLEPSSTITDKINEKIEANGGEPISSGSVGKKFQHNEDVLNAFGIDFYKYENKRPVEYKLSLNDPLEGVDPVSFPITCNKCKRLEFYQDEVDYCQIHKVDIPDPGREVRCSKFEFKEVEYQIESIQESYVQEADEDFVDMDALYGEVFDPDEDLEPNVEVQEELDSIPKEYESVFG